MLAYMDDILDPDDAREIGKKIEESEFATNLLHRARDVMRRLRLGAPSVADRGPGLDPNTVAEYLDNTLPGDRVPDFEKICLESDVHLAEVAACHQVLTLVLGEPAEIEAASRQRMYGVPGLLAVQEKAVAAAAAMPPGATVKEDKSPERKTEDTTPVGKTEETPALAESLLPHSKYAVPEYLRDPPGARRALPWKFVAVLALLVIVLGLALLWRGSSLASLLGMKAPEQPVANVAVADKARADLPVVKDQPSPKGNESRPGAGVAKSPPVAAAPVLPAAPQPGAESKAPGGAAKPVASIAPAERPAERGKLAEKQPIAPGAGAATPPAAVMSPVATAETKGPAVPAAATPPALVPAPPAAAKLVPAGKSMAAASLPNPGAIIPPKPRPEETPPELAPLPPERVGRLVEDKAVLLQYDSVADVWHRMPPHSVLVSSQPLLALPAFKSTLALAIPVMVNVLGGTELELMPNDVTGVPGLDVHFGRLIIRPVSEAKVRLRLRIGPRQGVLTLKSGESSVAIEAARFRQPGTNPELQPGPLWARLYTTKGEISWEESGAHRPPISVPAPQRIMLDSRPISPLVDTAPPAWTMAADENTWTDAKAAPVIEQAMQQWDRPVALTLRELAEHRKMEVSRLAIRCMGYIGHFDRMLEMLNSLDQKINWPVYIQELQQAVDRGPETAAQVRLALEKRYPQEPAKLYQMLWGYTAQDLQNGRVAELVDYLDNELLIYRVVSFYNLEKLVGVGLAYHPDYPPAKRQASVAKWRERIPKPVEKEKAGLP
jgi:hypothetical protein